MNVYAASVALLWRTALRAPWAPARDWPPQRGVAPPVAGTAPRAAGSWRGRLGRAPRE